MEALLAIATLLGGAAAIWFFWDKIADWWSAHFRRHKDLAIDFRNQPPFVTMEPNGAAEHAIRGYRIQVSNVGNANLDSCLAKLETMRLTNRSGFHNAFLPVGLRTQHQNLQQREGGKFNLRAGEHKLIEVAYLNEQDSSSEIALQYETDKYPNLVPRGDYVLTIKVYGGRQPASGDFRMFVDGEGYLKFSEHA